MTAASRADPLVRAMPAVFVLIWSTGFIVARYGMPHAPPMKFLAVRYLLSVLCFVAWALAVRAAWPRGGRQWAHLGVTGVLMHAGYLGGVWAAVKSGMGAGLAALLVGLQPVLTALWVSARGGQLHEVGRAHVARRHEALLVQGACRDGQQRDAGEHQVHRMHLAQAELLPHHQQQAEQAQAQTSPLPRLDLAAAPAIAAWVRDNVPDAILIGPDSESAQWVADIAARADVPYQVLAKTRQGDRSVSVSLADAVVARGRTPVVVDDIVSSGHTMLETLKHLSGLGLAPATCLVTHAVFSDEAHGRLLAAGAQRVVSTDTIPHPTNAISVAPFLAAACDALLTERAWHDAPPSPASFPNRPDPS